MSSIRQPIELQYGNFFNLQRLFRRADQHRLYQRAEFYYRLGVVGFVLLNCYTCLNGSTVGSFFNVDPPTIEEYLPWDEELRPYVPYQHNSYYRYQQGDVI